MQKFNIYEIDQIVTNKAVSKKAKAKAQSFTFFYD